MLSQALGVVIILVVVPSSNGAKDLRGISGEVPERQLAAHTGWKIFSETMRNELSKYNVSATVQVPKKATASDSKDLQKALRMSPETYAMLCSYFDRVDANGNGRLHEVEFVKAVPRDAKVTGQDIFEHFASDGAGGEMTLQEFLRFAMIVLAKPYEYHWSKEDLKELPTWKTWQDHDRVDLLKLFMVFDADSDDRVTIVEFENAWMGPLLWKLRQEDVVSYKWMSTDEEFKYANHVFDQRSGSDLQLDLTEWVHLLYEARKKSSPKSLCMSLYHVPFMSALVSVLQFA